MRQTLAALAALLFSSCFEPPPSVKPVQGFDASRYTGKWYEVARLENTFEKGLDHTTAEYSLREDGGLTVVNKGFKSEKQEWKSVTGRAYFVKNPGLGHLKVSFFRPFYGAYAIFYLDSQYQYSFVSGGDLKYLWLLSRTPTVEDSVKALFIEKASALGFATDKLIWVEQQ